jgi:hypothetical protein
LEIAELEGVAGGTVTGSANKNKALGFDKNASQQIFMGGQ